MLEDTEGLTSIHAVTSSLPPLVVNKHRHPFVIHSHCQSVDVTFPPPALPLAPRSLFFPSLLSFTAEDKLLLCPCGPLPHLSAPLSSPLPLPLSPALLLSPSPHLLEQLLLPTHCCLPLISCQSRRLPPPFLRAPSSPKCHSPCGYKAQSRGVRSSTRSHR